MTANAVADAVKDVAEGAAAFVEEMTNEGSAAMGSSAIVDANGDEADEDEEEDGDGELEEDQAETGGVDKDEAAARRKKLNALRARMVRLLLLLRGILLTWVLVKSIIFSNSTLWFAPMKPRFRLMCHF